MKIIRIVLLVTIGLVLSACGDRLVFVTKTSIGVDVGVGSSVENSMHIGFKRIEGVIDPIRCNKDHSGKETCEAQSVLAKLNFGVVSGDSENNDPNVNVAQWFATGEAATELAEHREIVALALAGKDIKLATSFQQGIDLPQLSIIKSLSSKYNKLNQEKMDVINKISQQILSEYSRDDSTNKRFYNLVAFYEECNSGKCDFKGAKTFNQLSTSIDNKLATLLIEMINITLLKPKGE